MPPFTARLAVLAAVLGVALIAATGARAFTMDYQANTNADGSAKYADPEKRFSGSQNGQNNVKQGNTTIQFGGRPSFNQQYNSNSLFDPGSRLNNER